MVEVFQVADPILDVFLPEHFEYTFRGEICHASVTAVWRGLYGRDVTGESSGSWIPAGISYTGGVQLGDLVMDKTLVYCRFLGMASQGPGGRTKPIVQVPYLMFSEVLAKETAIAEM